MKKKVTEAATTNFHRTLYRKDECSNLFKAAAHSNSQSTKPEELNYLKARYRTFSANLIHLNY